ncbi:MAG: ParB/RepB/Spo0J family partition protein, partial [Coprobacillaceae bacterium]
MLLENMQRNDLTPYEQAQGFQMCLDLGVTTKELSTKTGLSQKTVKHRLKMLELDSEEVRVTTARGGTIEDYIKLEQITDIKLKNEVLKHMGTNNFDYKLRNAIQQEKYEKKQAKKVAILSTFAAETEDRPEGYVNVEYYYSNEEEVKIPEDIETRKYMYQLPSFIGGCIYLYGEKLEQEETKKEQNTTARNEKEEQITKLRGAFDTALETRKSFMKEFVKKHKSYEQQIIEYAGFVIALTDVAGLSIDDGLFEFLTGIQLKDFYDDEFLPQIKEIMKEYTTPRLAALIYSSLEVTSSHRFINYNGIFDDDDESLKDVYNFLVSIGYEISEEEKQLINGTHEFYVKGD